MQVLCARLRSTNRAVEEITTLTLSARLGRLLLRLAESCGARTEQALRLDLRLSQKDLGTLVGASREKVNRQLRVWEQNGRAGAGAGVYGDPEAGGSGRR